MPDMPVAILEFFLFPCVDGLMAPLLPLVQVVQEVRGCEHELTDCPVCIDRLAGFHLVFPTQNAYCWQPLLGLAIQLLWRPWKHATQLAMLG